MTNSKALAGGIGAGIAQTVAELTTQTCLWLGAPLEVCTPLGVVVGMAVGFLVVYFAPANSGARLSTTTLSTEIGRVEVRALGAALAVAVVLLLALRALAGPNIITQEILVTETPAAVGVESGRCYLEIQVNAESGAGVRCGKMTQEVADWWPLDVGQQKAFGIVFRGQCTAQNVIGCVAVNPDPEATPEGTPEPIEAIVNVSQEGGMPELTGTATATGTATDTATPASTPTQTPVNTATPVSTATRTPNATKTQTPASTSTPANTATPAPTDTPG